MGTWFRRGWRADPQHWSSPPTTVVPSDWCSESYGAFRFLTVRHWPGKGSSLPQRSRDRALS
jgi:hypothetical protein